MKERFRDIYGNILLVKVFSLLDFFLNRMKENKNTRLIVLNTYTLQKLGSVSGSIFNMNFALTLHI